MLLVSLYTNNVTQGPSVITVPLFMAKQLEYTFVQPEPTMQSTREMKLIEELQCFPGATELEL